VRPDDGIKLPGQGAEFLALVLLRADAAADRGQDVRFLDCGYRLLEIVFLDRFDEARDRNIDRAPGHAGLVLALKAAERFGHGLLF
jgi:hypothetical protein